MRKIKITEIFKINIMHMKNYFEKSFTVKLFWLKS